MRELFDRLSKEGEPGIRRLIAERMQEGVQLDFKQKGDPRKGGFDANDKKILAKAVSGFANSAGGLLVWGVNAEKGPDGIDCAQAPAAPIAQIDLFLSEATTLVGQLIQPRHDGIQLRSVPSASAPGSGYLLIYVQRSERRPHRSEASGQKQYFKRAGDSFFEMEHYDIEDAFKRFAVPDLRLTWRVDPIIRDGDGNTVCELVLQLKNVSEVTAKYPYLDLKGHIFGEIRSQPRFEYRQRQEGDWLCFVAMPDHVINPGTSSSVAEIRSGIVLRSYGLYELNNARQGRYLNLEYRLGCENTRQRSGRLDLPLEGLGAEVGEAEP
ncbi:helix-turn-helix domain-containing protein [Methylobacterium sp. E-046]|uniref:AlbA family DNA-binding domain-containing protein n=1 Tax=Methylobacterium sp. E-046 TaxID=2836576 RepID=UPI001FBAA5A5|nr:ATP-binding protein [Methylobacterium sp. E-046]MCJ2099020.1 ATP-binding protein [Methylobacterium sp. E-046]